MKKWTDEDMLKFYKIGCNGSYGEYWDCPKIEQKLKRYEDIKNNPPKIAKIVVDRDDSLEELLLSLGYSKRSGACVYSEGLKTIVILPSKKWFWTDLDIKRGYTKIKQ